VSVRHSHGDVVGDQVEDRDEEWLASGPYPLESVVERLVGAQTASRPGATRELYLDVAEAIVDQACAWLDNRGIVIDPVEGSDRWRGGTAARFACPAALLVRDRSRTDLVPFAARTLDQLSDGLRSSARGEPIYPPGVLDARERAVGWRQALGALSADRAYTVHDTLRAGKRLHNFGVYACVGEWLRYRLGVADERAWVEQVLDVELPMFTRCAL